MANEAFQSRLKKKRERLHQENIQDLKDVAIIPVSYEEDPEYGEYVTSSYSLNSYFSPYVNEVFTIPRKIPSVNRGAYQKEMALYYDNENNFRTLKPLDPEKFYLSNGETQNHFTPELVYYLEVLYGELCSKIRDKASKNRLIIGSGFRSIEYNNNLNGAATWSAHSGGMAVDIHTSYKEDRILILDTAYHLGFGGLGLYDTFVHVDVSGRATWGGYSGPAR